MKSSLAGASTPTLLVIAGIFGGLGVAGTALGFAEGVHIVAALGLGGVSLALACLVLIALRIGRSGLRGTANLARQAAAARGGKRKALIAGGIGFALLLLLVTHNWVSWHGVQRDCNAARESADLAEARAALERATQTMQNPLLIIPSGVFDLYGPNRCRKARERLASESTD